jgi:hypothetical protein
MDAEAAESGLEVFYMRQEPFYSQARFPIGQLLLYRLQGDSVEQDIGSQKVKDRTRHGTKGKPGRKLLRIEREQFRLNSDGFNLEGS